MNPEQEKLLSTQPADAKRRVGEVTMSSANAGLLAGAVAWLIFMSTDVEMPPGVVEAIALLIGYAGNIVGGWLVKPGTGKRRG